MVAKSAIRLVSPAVLATANDYGAPSLKESGRLQSEIVTGYEHRLIWGNFAERLPDLARGSNSAELRIVRKEDHRIGVGASLSCRDAFSKVGRETVRDCITVNSAENLEVRHVA